MDYRKKKNSRLRIPPFPWQIHQPSSPMAFFFFFFSFILFVYFFLSSSSFTQLLTMLPTSLVSREDYDEALLLPVESTVLFPHHALLLINKIYNKKIDDIYFCSYPHSSSSSQVLLLPVLSVDFYDHLRWLARCPLPPYNQSSPLDLQRGGGGRKVRRRISSTHEAFSWKSLAYAASLDSSSSVLVFVKGLNLKPGRIHHDPSRFFCHFRFSSQNQFHSTNSVAIAAAQEVVRCNLPEIVKKNLRKEEEIYVTVGFTNPNRRPETLPSVARVSPEKEEIKVGKKEELCICTMLRNQARNLKEWVMYHTWLGVDRWFIYDNNSEDEIKNTIATLRSKGYQISRHPWPWLKTQEAGFSHCAIKSKQFCNWVGFLDIDEFFHFPNLKNLHRSKRGDLDPLKNMILSNTESSKAKVGEIRTACHSFGPSGLKEIPSKGVMAGYTCRVLNAERHKSIVRGEALEETVMNVVHHFKLREGYEYVNNEEGGVVINHYKYQVWEVFKVKFWRRVATYVVDWERDENQGSRDRAPGLGREAVEPSDWGMRLCEVWDTGLRDFVAFFFADPATGLFPWMLP